MKIQVSHDQTYFLAEHFAQVIHSRVIEQHLYLIREESDRPELFPWPPMFEDRFRDMQATIRSIENPWDRKDFVNVIKMYFKKYRESQGTAIRGRDYVRRVMEYRATQKA